MDIRAGEASLDVGLWGKSMVFVFMFWCIQTRCSPVTTRREKQNGGAISS